MIRIHFVVNFIQVIALGRLNVRRNQKIKDLVADLEPANISKCAKKISMAFWCYTQSTGIFLEYRY